MAPMTSGNHNPGDLLAELFCSCQDELVGTLFYLLGNSEDAKDSVQEAFLKCWKQRDQFHRIQNPRAWIFRVAVNTAKDLRRNAWRRRTQPMDEEIQMMTANQPGPAKAAEQEEHVLRLRQAIFDLPEEEKKIFLLRQNGDLTYEQIAEALEVPLGTVKTRMRIALRKLRSVFGEEISGQVPITPAL